MDVLLDTGPLIASTVTRDAHHQITRSYSRTPGLRLHTTSAIAAETYTFLRRRTEYSVARRVVTSLRSNPTVRIHHVDEAFDRDTWAVLDEFVVVPLSYADATLVVLGRRTRIHQAFSFDEDLRAAGFELVPEG